MTGRHKYDKLLVWMSESMKDEKDCTERNPTSQSIYLVGRYINLSALSRKTGYTPSHLSRVVRGERTPSMPVLIEVAKALAVSTDSLINDLGRKKRKKK